MKRDGKGDKSWQSGWPPYLLQNDKTRFHAAALLKIYSCDKGAYKRVRRRVSVAAVLNMQMHAAHDNAVSQASCMLPLPNKTAAWALLCAQDQAVELSSCTRGHQLTKGLMMPAHDMLVLVIFTSCSRGTRAISGVIIPVMPALLLKSNSVRLYDSLSTGARGKEAWHHRR